MNALDLLELLHVFLENIVDAAILLSEFIGVGIIIFSRIRGFGLCPLYQTFTRHKAHSGQRTCHGTGI